MLQVRLPPRVKDVGRATWFVGEPFELPTSRLCFQLDGVEHRHEHDRQSPRCLSTPRQAKAQKAQRNANCRRQYGRGYYAGRPNRKGTYYCLPSRKTANAWCRKQNGRGTYAGKIRRNGAFSCYRKNNRRTVTRKHNRRNSAAAAEAGAAIVQGVLGAIGNSARSRETYRPRRTTRAPTINTS